MNITKTTVQYIGLSVAVSGLLIGIVAVASYFKITSLVEFAMILVTGGPLFAAIALAKIYFDSEAPKPTWKELIIMTAISFPILIGISIFVSSIAATVMVNLLLKDVMPAEVMANGSFWFVSGRAITNAAFGILVGTLFIFPKQLALRIKKSGRQ